jgi:hypothetical protein
MGARTTRCQARGYLFPGLATEIVSAHILGAQWALVSEKDGQERLNEAG